MLLAGANTARCSFRTQRDRVTPAIVEGVHLLLYDVRGFADATGEQPRVLDQRHANLAVAESVEHVGNTVLDPAPTRAVAGEHVLHAAHRLKLAHGEWSPAALSRAR